MSLKKHKKHKSEKRERHDDKSHPGGEKPPGLRLILKMSNSTPDNSCDSMGPMMDEESSRMSAASSSLLTSVRDDILNSSVNVSSDRSHKKAKKKKKKKEKDRDKHEKKHKHHHKDKRKRREESSQDDVSVGEESLPEPPAKRVGVEGPQPMDEQMLAVAREVDAGGTREPRSCVLRQRQERSALQRLLEYLLKALEKKDPKQLFAWPVTDHIAPGYSSIISQPMDFSTMKQKIDNGVYMTLIQFIDDFKLLCNNAMVYNQPNTIYYKAAKKLLHTGVKMMSADKLRPLRSVLTYMTDIGREALGFDVGEGPSGVAVAPDLLPANSPSTTPMEIGVEEPGIVDENTEGEVKKREIKPVLNKFEAIPDDLSPEEILEQSQKASQAASARLASRKLKTSMGFLRQRKDGTTSLNILVPGDGINMERKEKAVSLGAVTGKLTHGTGQLQGFREDRRNLAKTVKPLYYGAFGSYAPSHDSTFANLSKEESDLVYQTYGDEAAVQYAESILDFAKDNDYTITMVDNLLDILTHGEHRKTKKNLDDRRKMREEEDRLKAMLDGARTNDNPGATSVPTQTPTQAAPPPQGSTPQTGFQTINLDSLKSLGDLGIDTGFIEGIDALRQEIEEQKMAQAQLNHTGALLEKLQQVQSDRLSTAPPPHLSQVLQPSQMEQQLAEKITENLTDLAKRAPPGVIVPVSAVRKAMGVSPNIQTVNTSGGSPATDHLHSESSSGNPQTGVAASGSAGTSHHNPSANATSGVGVPDLETELREFLESEPSISNADMHDDQSIDEIFSVTGSV